jgi:hypothetical protein
LLLALMQTAIASEPATSDISAIDRVWSGHSVRFALVVNENSILVAYYDSNRQMTVASRPRGAAHWTYHKLPSWVGWDSHNYIAMAEDSVGHIHVLGNMHGDPLLYFRTGVAGDVRTLTRVPVLAEASVERRVTYPVFLKDSADRLILKYRDGGSGNGNEIYNVYDTATSAWRHLLAAPLTDGEGKRNAYFVGPTLGPDGFFHLAWVWRETPDAETNHDLSYARSRDLVTWERSDGSPLPLPITLARSEIVDPVPVRGGMINNNTIVGFDGSGRAMITFHKFDAHGNTQIFVARREKSRWNLRQVSDWQNFRWDFRGRGSLDSRLFVSGAVPAGDQRVRVSVIRDGKPIDFLLDERTLERVEERAGVNLAERLRPVMAVPEGMQLNLVEDPGTTGIAIAWSTRPPHRDLPTIDIPEPTVLTLVVPHEAP